MHNYTLSQIERFRREAKRLQRAETLRLADALDRVAMAHGFKNWSQLMKHRSADGIDSRPRPFLYSRGMDELREALRLAPTPRFGNRSDIARSRVEDICARFVSPANAVDFAIAFMQALLTLPRYRIAHATQAQWEMRCWLPYSVLSLEDSAKQILVNRRYKPVGQADDEFAHYERYGNLHLAMSTPQLESISARVGSGGFLYNDGCMPWRSRIDGEKYLDRLIRLRNAIAQ